MARKFLAFDIETAKQFPGDFSDWKKHRLRWISSRGKPRDMPLPKSWLTVQGALKLPLPDTSWMTNPIKRKQFTEWLG